MHDIQRSISLQSALICLSHRMDLIIFGRHQKCSRRHAWSGAVAVPLSVVCSLCILIGSSHAREYFAPCNWFRFIQPENGATVLQSGKQVKEDAATRSFVLHLLTMLSMFYSVGIVSMARALIHV